MIYKKRKVHWFCHEGGNWKFTGQRRMAYVYTGDDFSWTDRAPTSGDWIRATKLSLMLHGVTDACQNHRYT